MSGAELLNDRADIDVFDTSEDVALAVAEQFVRSCSAAIDARGVFRVALAGGSTPKRAYELLASGRFTGKVHWPKVRVFFGDERCVPPDHADSNYRSAHEALLKHVNVCPNCVYRIEAERGADAAADDYERILREQIGEDGRLDLVLLGLGTDGHTASLFPGSRALRERERWCVSNYVANLMTERVTLTYPIINAAREVVFAVTGAGKADAVHRVLTGPHDPVELPAQAVRPRPGDLTHLFDRTAAAKLPASLLPTD